jgi:hypothetical protein
MNSVLWILVGLILSIPWIALNFGTPLPYRYRPCQGKAWRTAYPSSSKTDIRRFLSCLCIGMGFSQKHRLLFSPDDRVDDVFKSIYAYELYAADHFEREDFLFELSEQFSVSLDELYNAWNEKLTLGHLFSTVAV